MINPAKLPRPSLLLLGALGLLFVQPVNAALFDPTGGKINLSASGSTVEGTDFSGSTDVTLSTNSFAVGPVTARVEPLPGMQAEFAVGVEPPTIGATAPDRLSISGSASGFSGPLTANSARGTGQLGFDLTKSTQLRYSFAWTGKANPFDIGNGSVSLFSDTATGTPLLSCVLSLVPFAPCAVTPDSPVSGLLSLEAGHYELLFGVGTGAAAGSTLPASFEFSIAPVPLPAGV